MEEEIFPENLADWPEEDVEEYAGALSVLPLEMIFEIISHLDRRSLGRLCTVNPFFCGLIQESEIGEMLAVPFLLNLGHFFTGAVNSRGSLFMWGDNRSGQLGMGTIYTVGEPTIVPTLSRKSILSLSCGETHAGCVTEEGSLYMWGRNDTGELGLGDTINYTTPQKVPFFSERKIVLISCGLSHTGCLTEKGEIYMWGNNYSGALGLGDTSTRYLPEKVSSLEDSQITHLSCGGSFTGCISEKGDLYMWGGNAYGRLGLGDHIDRSLPQRVDFHVPILSVSCSTFYAGCVTEEGELYMWGYNQFGQLGTGAGVVSSSTPQRVDSLLDQKIISLSCGNNHTGCITEQGQIYMWGDNYTGQLGLGIEDHIIPWPTLVPFSEGTKMVVLSCGNHHTGAVTSKGIVYMWGSNQMKQLGFDNEFRDPILLSGLQL